MHHGPGDLSDMDGAHYFTLDESLWPFVRVQLWGSPTNEQYMDYLETLARCLARQERHLLLLDMREARFATREQLHLQALWISKHEAALRAYALGTGFVVASPFVRLGMNVIFSLSPRTMPYFIAPTPEPAIAWSVQRLEEEGLHESAHRIRLHYGLAPALTG